MFDEMILALTILIVGFWVGFYSRGQAQYLADLDEGYKHGMEAAAIVSYGAEAR